MQRGTLVLTKEELIELVKHVEFEKLNIALNDIKDENRIFINEEELESILDEIGINNENSIIQNISKKLSDLLLSFRN